MSATIILGAAMCYAAALPSDNARQVQAVRVAQLQALPSGRPGAWVIVTTGRLEGIAWQVPADELTECAR